MATTPTQPDALLTIREVAEILKLCEKSVWIATAPRGNLRCVRVGRSVRYSRSEVDRFVRSLEAGSTSQGAA